MPALLTRQLLLYIKNKETNQIKKIKKNQRNKGVQIWRT